MDAVLKANVREWVERCVRRSALFTHEDMLYRGDEGGYSQSDGDEHSDFGAACGNCWSLNSNIYRWFGDDEGKYFIQEPVRILYLDKELVNLIAYTAGSGFSDGLEDTLRDIGFPDDEIDDCSWPYLIANDALFELIFEAADKIWGEYDAFQWYEFGYRQNSEDEVYILDWHLPHLSIFRFGESQGEVYIYEIVEALVKHAEHLHFGSAHAAGEFAAWLKGEINRLRFEGVSFSMVFIGEHEISFDRTHEVVVIPDHLKIYLKTKEYCCE